jgi:class 3 adenylate cyclase
VHKCRAFVLATKPITTLEPQTVTVSRRLTAILAADAANFSRLVAQDEERTLRVLSGHRSVIDGTISAHGGRIVSTAGDSVLAEFSSPVQAVRAAIEIQHALSARNAESGLPAPMMFRIGVNLGDVVVDGDNILGDGVNVAVRLENLAPPGGIYVSASVRDHVAGKLEARLQDLGSQFLKNIPRPVRVFQVLPDIAGSESFLLRARRGSAKVALGAAAAAVLLGVAAWFSATRPTAEFASNGTADSQLASSAASAEERAFWDSVKNTSNPAELRAFLSKFAQGTFAPLAQARLDGLLAARARSREEQEAATKAKEAQQAQAEAVRLRSDAEAAIARAASEQATATRLKAEAETASTRAAAAAKAAAEAQQKLARSQGAILGAASDRVTFVRAISPLDGRWTSDWSCEASAEQPAQTIRLPAQIQYREVKIESGQVGLPGYFRAYGSVAEDGTFHLVGTSLPRTQRIVGNEDAMQFAGRIEGERLEGNGTIGKRRCSFVLTRLAAQ